MLVSTDSVGNYEAINLTPWLTSTRQTSPSRPCDDIAMSDVLSTAPAPDWAVQVLQQYQHENTAEAVIHTNWREIWDKTFHVLSEAKVRGSARSSPTGSLLDFETVAPDAGTSNATALNLLSSAFKRQARSMDGSITKDVAAALISQSILVHLASEASAAARIAGVSHTRVKPCLLWNTDRLELLQAGVRIAGYIPPES
jgi:hypothetical protein